MRLWGSLRGCKGARATAPLTTLLLLLLPLLFAQTTSGNDQQPERLIGWRGESYNHQHHHAELQQQQQRGAGAGASAGGGGTRGGDRWIERLSLKPRAFLFHHFLSDDECDHVISLVEKRVFRSSVIDTETGAIKLDPIRTSYGSSIECVRGCCLRCVVLLRCGCVVALCVVGCWHLCSCSIDKPSACP